jgi:hypothetical protein
MATSRRRHVQHTGGKESMKTALQWIIENPLSRPADLNTQLLCGIKTVEAIQLDALKEAAGIAHRHSLLACQEILGTAEQLSEKDL